MSKIGKLRCLGTAFSKQIAVMFVICQKLEISDWFVPTTGFGVNLSTLVFRILKLDMSEIRKLRCLGTAFSQNSDVLLVIGPKLEISDWFVSTRGFVVK